MIEGSWFDVPEGAAAPTVSETTDMTAYGQVDPSSAADALARARARLDLTAVAPVSWAPTQPAVAPPRDQPLERSGTDVDGPEQADAGSTAPPVSLPDGAPTAAGDSGPTTSTADRPGTAVVRSSDDAERADLGPTAAEQLAAIRWRLDGGTLREVVDDFDALRELGARIDQPLADSSDSRSQSQLLSLRAVVYRLLGELGMAAAACRLALVHAQTSQDSQAVVVAQAELAHVLRLRGDFGEADVLFEYAASAEVPELLRCVVHENAGRSCFDQGRYMEALDHFARAVRLGDPADTDLVDRIDVALEAVYIRVLRDGWGPYPRMRREILEAGGAQAETVAAGTLASSARESEP